MEERSSGGYALAGWMAIISGILMWPSLLLGIILEFKKPMLAPLLVVYIPIALAQAATAIYAMYRLKTLLNERFQFHDVDVLIWVLIGALAALISIGLVGKVLTFLMPQAVAVAVVFGVTIILIALPMSIVGIIFAVILLRLRDDLWGLLRPYAYTSMAAAIFMATLIGAPIGGILDSVASILLGVIFFRADKAEPSVEFV
jgi:hypothetical protein